jgi:hypothetical protein
MVAESSAADVIDDLSPGKNEKCVGSSEKMSPNKSIFAAVGSSSLLSFD